MGLTDFFILQSYTRLLLQLNLVLKTEEDKTGFVYSLRLLFDLL